MTTTFADILTALGTFLTDIGVAAVVPIAVIAALVVRNASKIKAWLR